MYKLFELKEIKTQKVLGFLKKRQKLLSQIDEIDEAIEDQTGQSICEVLESFEVQPSLHHAPFEQQ